MANNPGRLLQAAFIVLVSSLLLPGCNSDSDNKDGKAPAQQARDQDSRVFTVVEHIPASSTTPEYNLAFTALPGAMSYAGRYAGTHGEAAYQIEVPDNWNGMLVMYAHGYRGEGAVLTVGPPSIRNWLIENGYAWAASSYSANFYDVRAGIEDTNALVLAFNTLTGKGIPSKIYITGHSMGGHIAAAAIEEETYATARNKVQYAGSVPMCGVTGDTFEFDYLTNFTFAAQQLAAELDPELAFTSRPATNFDAGKINAVLWTTPPTQTAPGVPTPQGIKLENLVRQLSGGDRPLYEAGFRGYYYNVVMGTGGRDGTVNGILAGQYGSNIGQVYQLDRDPLTLTAEEIAFNHAIPRVASDPDANALRPDGLRWIPVIQGRFNVPVVSLQGLGDLYVPFRHGQLYRQRAEDHANGHWLVQRAIRSPGHCDYTNAEQVNAFSAMIDWEQNGVRPSGDNVTDAEIISEATYGCAYTTAPTAAETTVAFARGSLNAACGF